MLLLITCVLPNKQSACKTSSFSFFFFFLLNFSFISLNRSGKYFKLILIKRLQTVILARLNGARSGNYL